MEERKAIARQDRVLHQTEEEGSPMMRITPTKMKMLVDFLGTQLNMGRAGHGRSNMGAA